MSDVFAWLGIAVALGAILPGFFRKMALVWALLVVSNVLMAISSVLAGTWGWVAWSTIGALWCAFGLRAHSRRPRGAL